MNNLSDKIKEVYTDLMSMEKIKDINMNNIQAPYNQLEIKQDEVTE